MMRFMYLLFYVLWGGVHFKSCEVLAATSSVPMLKGKVATNLSWAADAMLVQDVIQAPRILVGNDLTTVLPVGGLLPLNRVPEGIRIDAASGRGPGPLTVKDHKLWAVRPGNATRMRTPAERSRQTGD